MAVVAAGPTPYMEDDPPPVVTAHLANVVTVEGTHTEPTIGQIWPR